MFGKHHRFDRQGKPECDFDIFETSAERPAWDDGDARRNRRRALAEGFTRECAPGTFGKADGCSRTACCGTSSWR